MSTTPQGPGWWQASDLHWYPPTEQPGMPSVGPTPRRRGERSSAQMIRNGVILLVVLVTAAGGLGWGLDGALDEIDTAPRLSARERSLQFCRSEFRRLTAAIGAANATPEPDVWSDHYDGVPSLGYWSVVGPDVVPKGSPLPGCP